MADQASDSVVIEADKAAVMAVIADFAAYPQWVDMVKEAEVLSKGPDGRPQQVRFVLDAGVIKDEYVLDYTWQGDDAVSWHLVRSKTLKAQDGSYALAESRGATTVTYNLSVDLKMPVFGAIKRKAQKVIIDTALKGLKKRVEARA